MYLTIANRLRETMALHVFTSVTSNYLPKARVLAQSVKRNLPGCVFHLVLVDTAPVGFDLRNEPFDDLISVSDMRLPKRDQWMFQHSVVEACTGVKGFAIQRLLANKDCDGVLYFDPDIVILSPLDQLIEHLKRSAVVLTPHLTEPESAKEAIQDNEFSVLLHGIYNLGFLGVRACPEGRRFADWWANRLESFCFDDKVRGLFTDQRWVDLAPAYFDGVEILRDPGYNVCTWNLTHRRVEGNLREGFTVNGGPLFFYHFSGLDSGAQKTMLDRYGSQMPALYELREWYLAECDRMGQQEFEDLPWSFDFFDNGERIRPAHRQLYRDRPDLQRAFPDPFSTVDARRSYYHWFGMHAGDGAVPEAESGPPMGVALKAGRSAGKEPWGEREVQYRIYVWTGGVDAATAAVFLKGLRGRTYQGGNVYLVGPMRDLEFLRQCDGAPPFGAMATGDGISQAQAFAAVANESGGEWDFIFLTTGVTVPDLWDLRLAWTAERISGVATVSPINEGSRWTSLGIASSSDWVDAIDRVCYRHSPMRNPEIEEFLADCFYVRREAVRDVLTTGRVPDSWSAFGEMCSRFRWSHALADHIYTGTTRLTVAEPAAGRMALEEVSARVKEFLAGRAGAPLESIRARAMSRQLHILHSWGGGLDRWVTEYCRADRARKNLILKSVGSWGEFGQELHLYESIDDSTPVRQWALYPGVKHTAIHHSGYQLALAEITEAYGIDHILVSSLIGHSLDALDAGVAATLIAHDFYPFCPALNITFESVCRRCTESDLRRCTEGNVHHRFFPNVPPAEWMELRQAFSERVLRGGVKIVAPSPSVPRYYSDLAVELKDCFEVIPHGVRPFEEGPIGWEESKGERLRIVVLGSLAPQKGSELLKQILPGLRPFADLFLVGCGEHGRQFESARGVVTIPEYEWHELPGLLQSIRPHAGLLLSVVPETFGYTLQELMNLAIPPVATRVGSFADWIEDGVTGFLCDPEPAAVEASLLRLNAERKLLASVHQRLLGRKPRGMPEMVADYESRLGLASFSARAYFERRDGREHAAGAGAKMRLTWRTFTGDGAESADRATVGDTGNELLRIAIPAQPGGGSQLRLELGEKPGFLILLRMSVRNAEEEEVWCWDERRGLPGGAWERMQALALNPGVLLQHSGRGSGWLLPLAETDLKGLERGGRLEMEFSTPAAERLISILPSIVAAQAGESSEWQREMMRQVLTGRARKDRSQIGGASDERLRRRFMDAQRRVNELEASLSWRITAPLRWGGTQVLKWSHRKRPGPLS